jgi:hypothetical protein
MYNNYFIYIYLVHFKIKHLPFVKKDNKIEIDATVTSLYRNKDLMHFTLVSSVKEIMLGRHNAASDKFRPPDTMQ